MIPNITGINKAINNLEKSLRDIAYEAYLRGLSDGFEKKDRICPKSYDPVKKFYDTGYEMALKLLESCID